MDSVDLLAREEEFRRLNKQLEKKTLSLMKEIEKTMQKKDFFTEYSPNFSSNVHQTSKKHHCCDTPKFVTPELTPTKINNLKIKKDTDHVKQSNEFPRNEVINQPLDTQAELINSHEFVKEKKHSISSNVKCNCCISPRYPCNNENLEFLQAFVAVNAQLHVLPESFLKEKVTVESVCKFLAAKVKLLQEQISKLQSTLERKVSQCECHLTQIAEFETERLKLLNKNNSLKAETTESKSKAMALQNRLNEKERLYNEQRTESDKLSSEVKRLRSRNASVEAKCVSQEEEIERLRMQVESLKTAEKDFRASTRSLTASHTSAISHLDARVKTLISTVEKQRALIENLRQQISLLSMENAVKAVEKEFVDFLKKD